MTLDLSHLPLSSPPILDSIAVIVPVFNCTRLDNGEAIFSEVLTSIQASIDYFREHYPWSEKITLEVAIVDDASTDSTGNLALDFVQNNLDWWYVRHPDNLGQAAARNSGIRVVRSQAICFCDADDPYQLEHLLVCFALLNHPLPQPVATLPDLSDRYPALVKTGIAFSDPIHPDWKAGLENTLCQNRCIRRELHEFIEGFPEDQVFRAAYEDAVYDAWACAFAPVVKVPWETVVYRRYPGNSFDRQLAKFQRPASEMILETSAAAVAIEAERSARFHNHLTYLQQKRQRILSTP